jgi:hypothetical protein
MAWKRVIGSFSGANVTLRCSDGEAMRHISSSEQWICLTKMLAQFLVQLLAPVLGDENNVLFALPFRVA